MVDEVRNPSPTLDARSVDWLEPRAPLEIW